MARREKSLTVKAARQLLRRNGTRLVLTNTARGREFNVVPGGPLTEGRAREVLRMCRPVDAGLFPEIAQSWVLK